MAPQQEANADERLELLMQRYQQGDPEAVEALVARLSPSLLRFFASNGNDRAASEDLLQDCWIRIHKARHTFRPSEPLMPWIFAIARHTRLDGVRKKRRRAAREVLVESLPEHMHQVEQPKLGSRQRLQEMLAQLPDSQREVILMLKVSGLSLEEVAQATSSTVGAVKQKAHRAYEKLRRYLQEKERQRS
jgi:RNA polymerase sigma-70 factor, ECF subfamily